MEKGLTDEIKTADEVLTEYVDNGWDVYEVEYNPPDAASLALGKLPGTQETRGVLARSAQWLIRTLVREVRSELGSGLDLQQQKPVDQRYMMTDDTADRMRSEYK